MSFIQSAFRSAVPLFILALALSSTPIFADGGDTGVAVTTATGDKTLYSDGSSTSGSPTTPETSPTSDQPASDSSSIPSESGASETASVPASPPVSLPSPEIIFKGMENKIELSRDGDMCTWSLETVKSEEVIEPLKAVFEKAIADDRIRIIENKSQNAIIARFISPTDGKIREEWADIMKSVDRPLEQVLFEILIVELVVNDIGQWGANLRALADSVVGGDNITQLINVSHTSVPIETEALNNEGFKYFMNNGNKIKALLFSGTTKNKVRVLSSPQIIASNHRPANFKLGRTLPIITGTQVTNGVTTYSYENKDIGININLTPHLSRSERVGLDISQEVNDLLSYDPDKKVADFAHKTLTSRVTLGDGQTVALGGYIQSSDRVNRKSVPGLSDLPYIGRYLNRDTKTQDKVEVIVFITPKILKSPAPIAAANYKKNVFKSKEAFVDKMEKHFVDGTKFYGNSSLKAGQKKPAPAKNKKETEKKTDSVSPPVKDSTPVGPPAGKLIPAKKDTVAQAEKSPVAMQALVEKIKKSHQQAQGSELKPVTRKMENRKETKTPSPLSTPASTPQKSGAST